MTAKLKIQYPSRLNGDSVNSHPLLTDPSSVHNFQMHSSVISPDCVTGFGEEMIKQVFPFMLSTISNNTTNKRIIMRMSVESMQYQFFNFPQ